MNQVLGAWKEISSQFRQCRSGSFELSGEPRSRGLPRSGVGLALTPGYAGAECVSQPRSRGFSLFGLSRANPRQVSQLKLNGEKPRERG